MKKLIIIFLGLTSLIACNQSNNTTTEIQRQISEYEVQIIDLKNKISKLKSQISDSVNSEDYSKKILVGINTIKPVKFTHYIEVTGNVEAKLESFISPEINGQIKSILVYEGDYVKKGQLLATIDTDLIRNTINEVKTQLDLAVTIYNKQKELWDQNIGSEIQFLQAKAKKRSLEEKMKTLNTQLEMANIKAPFDGYIESVFQKIGEIGSPGRQLFYLVNLKDLKVTANISESYIPFIQKGNNISVVFPTFPDITINTKIDVVGSVINPNNRTIKIQIPITNINNKLKPNIIANIKLTDFSTDSALIVPSIVVKNDANSENYIYITEKRNNKLYAKKTYVITGKSYGNKTMILKGLKPGDNIIVQGYNLVKNSSLIKIKK